MGWGDPGRGGGAGGALDVQEGGGGGGLRVLPGQIPRGTAQQHGLHGETEVRGGGSAGVEAPQRHDATSGYSTLQGGETVVSVERMDRWPP